MLEVVDSRGASYYVVSLFYVDLGSIARSLICPGVDQWMRTGGKKNLDDHEVLMKTWGANVTSSRCQRKRNNGDNLIEY